LQVVLRRYTNRFVHANSNVVGNYPPVINSQFQATANIPVSTESFTQEISNGASKLLQLLSKLLNEPISDRSINQYWQQVQDSSNDSSLQLTITVNLSMAD
jgi:hypothetical protein